jgi:hypothetical protein
VPGASSQAFACGGRLPFARGRVHAARLVPSGLHLLAGEHLETFLATVGSTTSRAMWRSGSRGRLGAVHECGLLGRRAAHQPAMRHKPGWIRRARDTRWARDLPVGRCPAGRGARRQRVEPGAFVDRVPLRGDAVAFASQLRRTQGHRADFGARSRCRDRCYRPRYRNEMSSAEGTLVMQSSSAGGTRAARAKAQSHAGGWSQEDGRRPCLPPAGSRSPPQGGNPTEA